MHKQYIKILLLLPIFIEFNLINEKEMYIFYGDESGFSKKKTYDEQSPITVVAGILIPVEKTSKITPIVKRCLHEINTSIRRRRTEVELKFNLFRKNPMYSTGTTMANQIALDYLKGFLINLYRETNFKLFYSAIDNQIFYRLADTTFTTMLPHPYLCASYKTLSIINEYQNTDFSTIVVLDEQNTYHKPLADLLSNPIHHKTFNSFIDTTFFAKSDHSPSIQIGDIISGALRFMFFRRKTKGENDIWAKGLKDMFLNFEPHIIQNECFQSDMALNFSKIELTI